MRQATWPSWPKSPCMTSPARTGIWRISVPDSTLIVFGLAASSFAIPGLLGGRRLKMVATMIYDQYLAELNWPMGATIAVALLLINLLVMLSWNRLVERRYKRALGV